VEKTGSKAGHPRWATALIVLGAIVTLLAIFSIWANRQALNTDNWVDTSGRLLENEKVDEALGNYLALQLSSHDNLKTTLEAELPEKLKPLGAAVATGLVQVAPQIAERALQNPNVQELWRDANRLAHERLLKVLDGGGSAVSTENGEVTLELGPLVEKVGKEIGVGVGVAEKLPPAAGRLVILKSDQLSAAQTGAHLIRELPIVLTLLALLLYGLAVWLAGTGNRRRALRSVGVGFLVAGVLVLIGRKVGGDVLVDAVVKNPTAKPAVHDAWGIATSLLKTIAASSVAFGVIVFLAAWLAGPTGVATGLRREAAPYVRDHRWAAYATAAIVFLILIAWQPVAAFGKPLGMLVLAILLAVGTEVLRRQILREFPEGEGGGRVAALREHAGDLMGGRGKDDPAPDQATERVADLERLAALHRDGSLDDEEFAAAKADVLGG
jgi:hypothetical protein